MNEHWIWSNGCAGKFKSSRSFFWLCLLHKENIKHRWIFFETGHGKGEHDAAGACVKRALRRYQMNHSADWCVCANQVVQWCRLNLRHDYNQQSKDVRRYELCFQNRIIQLRMTLICTSTSIVFTCTCKIVYVGQFFLAYWNPRYRQINPIWC